MPLTKINTGTQIPGVISINQSLKNDAYDVIAKLQFADLGRGAGNLYNAGQARLDMQGQTPNGANIQVQIGNASVAAAVIAPTVQFINDPINQTGAKNAAISVLNQSLDSETIWHLTGTLP
jgi:hypothetical protein